MCENRGSRVKRSRTAASAHPKALFPKNIIELEKYLPEVLRGVDIVRFSDYNNSKIEVGTRANSTGWIRILKALHFRRAFLLSEEENPHSRRDVYVKL